MKSLKDYNLAALYEPLLLGIPIPHVKQLSLLLKETTEVHYELFDDEFFNTEFDGSSIRDYILPTVRSVYNEFFIKDQRFAETNNLINDDNYLDYFNKRKKLFQLGFDLEEFLQVLSKKIQKNIHMLDDFENIDRIQNILELIKDDYVGMKYYKCAYSHKLTQEIRDLKINKVIK